MAIPGPWMECVLFARDFYVLYLILPLQPCEAIMPSISGSGNGGSEISSNLLRETKPGTESRLSESRFGAYFVGV